MLPSAETSLIFVKTIIFQLGMYKEYSTLCESFKNVLSVFIPNISIDYISKELIIDDIIITEEI